VGLAQAQAQGQGQGQGQKQGQGQGQGQGQAYENLLGKVPGKLPGKASAHRGAHSFWRASADVAGDRGEGEEGAEEGSEGPGLVPRSETERLRGRRKPGLGLGASRGPPGGGRGGGRALVSPLPRLRCTVSSLRRLGRASRALAAAAPTSPTALTATAAAAPPTAAAPTAPTAAAAAAAAAAAEGTAAAARKGQQAQGQGYGAALLERGMGGSSVGGLRDPWAIQDRLGAGGLRPMPMPGIPSCVSQLHCLWMSCSRAIHLRGVRGGAVWDSVEVCGQAEWARYACKQMDKRVNAKALKREVECSVAVQPHPNIIEVRTPLPPSSPVPFPPPTSDWGRGAQVHPPPLSPFSLSSLPITAPHAPLASASNALLTQRR